MGFGILFIAFSMLFVPFGFQIDVDTNLGFDILPDLLAYFLIFRGLKNLQPYSKGFVRARQWTFPLMGLSAITLAAQAIAFAGKEVASIAQSLNTISTVVNTVEIVSTPFLIFMLYYLGIGIRELAGEVELPKIVARANIATFLSSTYLLGKLLIGLLPLPNLIHWLVLLLTYIVYFTYLYLLFSCYMHIVYADEEPKTIFNPLFNLLDKSNKKDSDQK